MFFSDPSPLDLSLLDYFFLDGALAADLVRLELHQSWRRGEPALLQLHLWNDRLYEWNQYRFAAVKLDLQQVITAADQVAHCADRIITAG